MSDEAQASQNPQDWPSSDDSLPAETREQIVEHSAAADKARAEEDELATAAAADVEDINETPPEPAL